MNAMWIESLNGLKHRVKIFENDDMTSTRRQIFHILFSNSYLSLSTILLSTPTRTHQTLNTLSLNHPSKSTLRHTIHQTLTSPSLSPSKSTLTLTHTRRGLPLLTQISCEQIERELSSDQDRARTRYCENHGTLTIQDDQGQKYVCDDSCRLDRCDSVFT